MRSSQEGDDSDDASARSGARLGRSPAAAILGRLVIVVAVVAVAGTTTWALSRAASPEAGPTTTEIPALAVQAAAVTPGSATPVNATVAGEGGANSSGVESPEPDSSGSTKSTRDLLAGWADRAASAVGIPARALVAYGNAELAMRSEKPSCKISWPTIAGIGRIESNHGQYGGAVLGADGRPSKPIIGVPLDGTPGVQAIPDTDGGRFDSDSVQDRAVGPLQFIPSTWAKFASDGVGDGDADPQRIDDAALAAGRYLCSGGRDISSAEGWWSGIMSYNSSIEYAQKVFGLADSYAKSAREVQVNE